MRLFDLQHGTDPIHVYGCHDQRVKRLEIEPGSPNVWFTASEDGTVREFDRRVRGKGLHAEYAGARSEHMWRYCNI